MEVNGLPLHALVVHAAVVLGPLAAVVGLIHAGVPPWRDWARWPLAVLAVVAVGAIWVAYLSGEDLEAANTYGGELAALVETHESRAGVLRWAMTGFGVVALAAAALHRRTGWVRIALAVGLAGTAVLALVYTILTGDAGAQVAWFGIQG